MRSKRLLWLLAIFSVALALTWSKTRHEERMASLEKPRLRAREVFGTPARLALPRSATAASPSPDSLPDFCSAQWRTVAAVSLDELQKQISGGALKLDPRCQTSERTLIKSPWMDQLYGAACSEALAQSGDSETKRGCLSALLFYRAAVIDRLAGEGDPRSFDSGVLMNKIMASFSELATDPKYLDRGLALADALIEKEPNLAAAYKARAAYLMMKAMEDPLSGDAFRRALDRYATFNPSDPDLVEARVSALKAAKDDVGFNRYVDELVRDNPNLGVGHYFRAASYWSAGQRPETISELERAVALEPREARFKDTLEKVRLADLKAPNLFSSSISFSFENI